VPFWADDLSIGNRLINARCETVHTLRAFREAYSRRRCLVPADGFFEWQKQGKLRQPFLIRRKDQAPFAFAGLWERWRQPGADDAVARSCTIITCPPNDLVAPLHDRMPVILAPDAHARWLDAKSDGRGLLKPCPWRPFRSTGGSIARTMTTRSAFSRSRSKAAWDYKAYAIPMVGFRAGQNGPPAGRMKAC
jgi:putative SOS response-associated peptidase YedK